MRGETRAPRFYQGSNSNAYVPLMHTFLQSGFSEKSEIVMPVRTLSTFGASELAGAPVRKTMELLRDFYEAQFSQRDPSIARSLFEMQLLGVVAEGGTANKRLLCENTDGAFRQIEDRIRLALECDMVEDGYTHPAEVYLEELFRDWGQEAGDWLIGIISGRRWNRSLAAGLLRVLSRQKPLTEEWRLSVIRSALSSADIELRDAGVQAAESWEDLGALEFLSKHSEPCTWLADYIRRVIRDLMG